MADEKFVTKTRQAVFVFPIGAVENLVLRELGTKQFPTAIGLKLCVSRLSEEDQRVEDMF